MSLGVPGKTSNEQQGDSLKESISAADASTMLMRLAGKQPPTCPAKKGEKGERLSNKHDSECSGKSDDLGFEIPDWNTDELDEAALSNFRDLFNTLDQSKTGIITADNLYEELHRIDSEITYSEVEDVLRKVDKDGNGEIDFDEFLYHMTNSGGELFGDGGDDEEKREKNKIRKRMFYTAITQFSIKQTLADIEKTFRKQAPHVISHYTAGARLIGLTTRQLERQMKKMQKSASKNDSPYAQPLPFVQIGREGKKNVVHRKKTKLPKEKPDASREILHKELPQDEADPAVDSLTKELQDTMMMLTQRTGNIVPQDANMIMQIRKKLGSVTAKIRERKTLEEEIDHSNLSTMPSLNKPRSAVIMKATEDKQSVTTSETRSASVSQPDPRKNFKSALGWTTPRIQYIDVVLPGLKMLLKEKPTFNDLHRIRAKAKQAIDAYYHNLRQSEIRNAWDHWDRIYADVIEPKKLLANFRAVYSAYSPHREEEAFVVCPWKPGPFRFLRHTQKTPVYEVPKSPSVAITGSPRHKSCNILSPKTVANAKTVGRNSPIMRYTPSPSFGRPSSSMPGASSFIAL